MRLGLSLSLGDRTAGLIPHVGPDALVAPALSGTPDVGAVLTLDPGSWTGSGTVTLSTQWTADGVPLPGETGLTLTVLSAHRGLRLGAFVLASDSDGTRVLDAGHIRIPPVWSVTSGAGLLTVHSLPDLSAPVVTGGTAQIAITG